MTTVNLAYPTGTLLLLGFVVRRLVLHGGRGPRRWCSWRTASPRPRSRTRFYLLGPRRGRGRRQHPRRRLAAGRDARRRGRLARAGRRTAARSTTGGPARAAPTVIFAAAGRRRARRGQLPPRQRAGGSWSATGAMCVIVVRLVLVGNQQRALERNTMLALTDDLTGLANRRAFYSRGGGAHRPRARRGPGDRPAADRPRSLQGAQRHARARRRRRPAARVRPPPAPRDADSARCSAGWAATSSSCCCRPARTRTAARRPRAGWRRSSSEPFQLDGLRTNVRASVGAAIGPLHGTDRAVLLRHADVAMYQAKTRQTEIEVYAPGEDRHSRERIELAGQLPDAIDHGQLVLHFQPKVELSSGRVAGVEALVRWQPSRARHARAQRVPATGRAARADAPPHAAGAAPGAAISRRVAAQAASSCRRRREHLRGQPAGPRASPATSPRSCAATARPRGASSSSSRRTR